MYITAMEDSFYTSREYSTDKRMVTDVKIAAFCRCGLLKLIKRKRRA